MGYGSGGGEQQSCCDSNLRAKYQTCALTPSCRFRWGVLVVVLVTGVKQSQLLDFKSWSRSGVWQKKSKKNVGPKEFWVPKNVGQKFFWSNEVWIQKSYGSKKFVDPNKNHV